MSLNLDENIALMYPAEMLKLMAVSCVSTASSAFRLLRIETDRSELSSAAQTVRFHSA